MRGAMRALRPLLAVSVLALLALPVRAETFAELRARFEKEKGRDFQTRYKTLQAISDLGTDEAARFIEDTIRNDSDSSIRANGIHQLARIQRPGVADALLKLYKDKPDQRGTVISAYTSYRTEPLPAAVVDECLSGTDSSVRSSLVRYLAKRKDPRFLREAERFLDEFPTSATSIVSELTTNLTPETGRMLVKLYDDTRSYDRDTIPKAFAGAPAEVRAVVAEAIARGKEPLLTKAAQIAARARVKEAEEALVGAVKAAKEDEKKAMLLEALGATGLESFEAQDLVISLLRSPKPTVAVAAVRALRASPAVEAIPVLIAMLRSEEGIIRAEVRVTLERMTGQQFGDMVDLWEKWWAEYGDEFDPRDVKPPAEDALDQTLVDLAIEKGAAALLKVQGKEEPWSYGGHPVGTTALVLLALHAAGVDGKDRGFAAALKYVLEQAVPAQTYDAGIVAMALETVGGKKYRTKVAEAAKQLLTTQNPEGFWGYPSGDGDHSNSQYAVLGLRSAVRAGVSVPERAFKAARDHFLSAVCDDGGWSYQPTFKTSSSSSMTSAGVSSLLICMENMPSLTEEEKATVMAAIDRGFDALGKNMKLDKDSLYALYGIERAGVLGGRASMGGNPWYVPGARRLIEEQGRDGFWHGQYHEAVDTAFAILFLKKATAPIYSR